MPSLRGLWCRLSKVHSYQDFGSPLPVWSADAVASEGFYRQVRRCGRCDDTYDTFAGFISAQEKPGIPGAKQAA